MTEIKGYCPMGCGPTLFAGAGGHITCSYLPCPDPASVHKILSNQEYELASEHMIFERIADD